MQNLSSVNLVQNYVLGKAMTYVAFLDKKQKAKIIITIDDKDISQYNKMQFAATAYSALLCMKEGAYSTHDSVYVLLFDRHADNGVCLAKAVYEDGRVNVYTFDKKEFGPSRDCIGIAEILDLIKIGENRDTTDADYVTVGEYARISAEEARKLHFELAMHHVSSLDVTDQLADVQSTSPSKRLFL